MSLKLVCFMAPGCSVTTVLLQVSHGKRPCLDMIPELRPQECNQMIRVMEQCWDQDHKKRPPFSGEEKINLSHSQFVLKFAVNVLSFNGGRGLGYFNY